MSEDLKRLEITLDEINNKFGKNNLTQIYENGLNYNDFHFEFGSIFGVAIFKRATDGQYMFVIIEKDNDFWFISKDISTDHSDRLKSLEDVVKNACNYVKTLDKLNYKNTANILKTIKMDLL